MVAAGSLDILESKLRQADTKLRRRSSLVVGRSLRIRTIDTGSCGAFESEIKLLASPHYDLHGFVSERLVFAGPVQGFRIHSHRVGVPIVLAAATLALTGGLAVNTFARALGMPFLGMPRSEGAAGPARGASRWQLPACSWRWGLPWC
jgi:hypothetical protein